MSNELTANVIISWANGTLRKLNRGFQKQFDVSGTKTLSLIQTIGTSDEVIALVDVGTPGFVLLINLDATNYVEAGSDGTVYPIKLRANGGWAFMQWNAAAIHLKANTGACDVEAIVFPL